MATSLFGATRSWKVDRDVRNYDSLVSLLIDNDPHGCLYTLVGNRRSGKTFALKSLQSLLPDGRFIDLQGTPLKTLSEIKQGVALVDEPGRLLSQDGGVDELLGVCNHLKSCGVRVLLALTPGEWRTLDKAGKHLVNIKDRQVLPPLDSSQARSQARGTPWASQLVEVLLSYSPHWTYNPFLLELLLQVSESHFPVKTLWQDPERLAELFSQVRVAAESDNHTYVSDLLDKGLLPEQRQTLIRISRYQPLDSGGDVALLRDCGLISGHKGQYSLRDPLLQLHLPPPLRIHHISDLHFGPKTMAGVDAKEKGDHGTQLSAAAGPATVRDAYLSHLHSERGTERGVHALVISGDLAETGTRDQLKDARDWIDRASAALTSHPRLRGDDRRVMVVGGNHDVDWSSAARGPNSQERHRTFADVLGDIPHPHLETPPESRKLASVRWPDAGITLVLLGSAEWGGTVVGATPGEDTYAGRLTQLVEEIRGDGITALSQGKLERYSEIRRKLDTIDPSVVHDRDLDRIRSLNTSEPVRIAVLHHPVSPVPAPPEIAAFTGLLNAGAVKDALLAHSFQLVLHGHQHVGWLGKETWPGRHGDRTLHIASAPTLGSRETADQLGFVEIAVFYEGYKPVEVELAVVKRIGTQWTRTAEVMTIPITGVS